MPIYLVIFFYFMLLCFSALFSGLNLGLMSLDLNELNLLKKIGSDKEKVYANNIYPLRTRGNYLLCTILLGNVMVNSTSTLIMGNYLEGRLFIRSKISWDWLDYYAAWRYNKVFCTKYKKILEQGLMPEMTALLWDFLRVF